MGVASGIGSQIGVSPETTYGTYAAVSRWAMADKVSLKKVKNIAQGNGLGAGRLMLLGSRRVPTTKAAKGTIEMEVANKAMGQYIQALMGTTITPVQQGGTAGYLQTHTLADPLGKSLSIQAGIPDAGGTSRPYTFLGCKVLGGQFTFDVDKEIMAVFDIDAQDVSEATGLVAASYGTNTRPFVGTDMTVKTGTFGAEASTNGVTKATVKIERGSKDDRFYFGAGGKKGEPIINEYAKITGTLSADYVDKTVFADKFAADTPFSLVLEAIGNLVSGAVFETFRITLPQCFLDGDTPTVEGPDVISGDLPFVCLYDATNLPKIEIIEQAVTI